MEEKNTQQKQPAKLLELIDRADEVKVKEVSINDLAKHTSSIGDVFFKNDRNSTQRTFVLQVRNRASLEELATQGFSHQNRDYLVRSAGLLIDYGDYLLARNIYSYLLRQNVKDPDCLKGLGRCLFHLHQVGSAKKCFNALWNVHEKEDALLWLGKCAVAEGDEGAALRNFQSIKKPEYLSRKDRFEFYKELGNCQTRLGMYEEANKAYIEANALDPDSDVLAINRGTLEIQLENYGTAETHFHRAIKLNESNAKAFCGLGLIALKRKDFLNSEQCFYKALDVDSQNLVAILQLVSLAHESGRYKALKERIHKFLIQSPKHIDVRYALATILFQENDWSQCERELEQILRVEPGHLKASKLREELGKNKGRTP